MLQEVIFKIMNQFTDKDWDRIISTVCLLKIRFGIVWGFYVKKYLMFYVALHLKIEADSQGI